MAKYKVIGTISHGVYVEVEAENEDEAERLAEGISLGDWKDTNGGAEFELWDIQQVTPN